TPAGSYLAPVFAGESAVLAQNASESGHPDAAGRVVTPMIRKAAHNLGRMAAAAACRLRDLPDVFKSAVALHTSTRTSSSGKPRTIKPYPDAQGQKMKTRTLQLASVGLAVLALNSCGQKPAPAETLDSAKPAAASPAANAANKGSAQAMRVTRV